MRGTSAYAPRVRVLLTRVTAMLFLMASLAALVGSLAGIELLAGVGSVAIPVVLAWAWLCARRHPEFVDGAE